MSNSKLKPIEKIGYGMGDFASNIVFQAVIIFLQPFYTNIYGLEAASVAFMFLAVRIVDMVTDPLMGIIADRTKTKWGRYRPYLIWFAVPFSILLVLTFTTPNFGEQGKLIYAYLTYAFLMVLYTVVNIPYCSLGGVITSDSHERVSANSYRFFLATAAGVLIGFFIPKLVDYFGNGNEQAGYPYAMAVFGVFAIAAFFGCFALTKERVKQAVPAKGSFRKDISTLLKNDQWWIVAVLFFVLLVGIVMRAASQVNYVQFVLSDKTLIGSFITAGLVAQMIGATCASPLSKKIGNVPAYILIQIMIVIGSMALYFAPTSNLALVYGGFIFISFFAQMGAPILFTMVADTVDYGELKSGNRVTGLAFSGVLFTLKLGVALAGFLTPMLLAMNGFQGTDEHQLPEAKETILLSLTLYPAIAHFLLIPIVSIYKLNKVRCDQIRSELDKKATV